MARLSWDQFSIRIRCWLWFAQDSRTHSALVQAAYAIAARYMVKAYLAERRKRQGRKTESMLYGMRGGGKTDRMRQIMASLPAGPNTWIRDKFIRGRDA